MNNVAMKMLLYNFTKANRDSRVSSNNVKNVSLDLFQIYRKNMFSFSKSFSHNDYLSKVACIYIKVKKLNTVIVIDY